MIELSAGEALFIGSGFTVVGALIGAWATIFSARMSAERHRLYEESATFQAEFVEEPLYVSGSKSGRFRDS